MTTAVDHAQVAQHSMAHTRQTSARLLAELAIAALKAEAGVR